MKRFLIATALTASLSTAAIAATEAEIAQIQSYAPNVDAQSLTDQQVAEAMNIISSGESRSDTMARLNSLLGMDNNMASAAMPTEAERAEIERFAPGVDYTAVTNAQVATAMSYINSEMSPSDIEARVQQVLNVDATPVSDANTASAAEVAILQRYLPDMEVAMLSEAQLNSALAIVYGGGSESEIQAELESIAN